MLMPSQLLSSTSTVGPPIALLAPRLAAPTLLNAGPPSCSVPLHSVALQRLTVSTLAPNGACGDCGGTREKTPLLSLLADTAAWCGHRGSPSQLPGPLLLWGSGWGPMLRACRSSSPSEQGLPESSSARSAIFLHCASSCSSPLVRRVLSRLQSSIKLEHSFQSYVYTSVWLP